MQTLRPACLLLSLAWAAVLTHAACTSNTPALVRIIHPHLSSVKLHASGHLPPDLQEAEAFNLITHCGLCEPRVLPVSHTPSSSSSRTASSVLPVRPCQPGSAPAMRITPLPGSSSASWNRSMAAWYSPALNLASPRSMASRHFWGLQSPHHHAVPHLSQAGRGSGSGK